MNVATQPSRPILRYHGGKWLLAPWIISHFPEHSIYTEAFGGAGSVLLRKPRCYAEIYNDLDGEIVNLFRVVRDRGDELLRLVELTPYARAEFHESFVACEDSLERARRTVMRSFMGFGGNLTRPNRDQTPQRTGFRNYSKKNSQSSPANDWRNLPQGLPSLIDRLRGVIIENRPAASVLLEHDSVDTLHYVDPPYVHSTRGFDCGGTHRGYRHELSDDDHRALAVTLRALEGRVIVSGYQCELYDSELFTDWRCVLRPARADGARERTEALWFSPNCSDMAARELFEEVAAA